MDREELIDRLIGPLDDIQKIKAVRCLALLTDDTWVMDALCETAVSTTNHRLREVLIDALKSNPAGACRRFIEYALRSAIPSYRKWALVNLSLLGCREAKDAVIGGLGDRDETVRKAAAMSTGLYDDIDVLNALERYFECHRFDLTISFIKEGIDELKKNTDDPDDEDVSGHSIGVTRLCPSLAG